MEMFRDGAAALGRRIAAGEADPVEVAEAALDAIETHPEGRRIFVRATPERAMAEAEAASLRARDGRRRGPLDGVPLSWKDLVDSAGVPTEGGTRMLAGRVPERDAAILSHASAAGTVCLGKTHLSELAFSGLGLNPMTATAPNVNDPRWVPGGSSSGAAASVAFGLAPAAIGSDTGGSIRLPAAWNDLVGFKPGWGVLSTDGMLPLMETFDCPGPLARTVEDCALIHAALGGAAVSLEGATLEGAQLLIPEGLLMEDVEDAPARAFEDAVRRLEAAGAAVLRQPVPVLRDANALSVTLYSGEAWAIWRDLLTEKGHMVYSEISQRIEAGRDLAAADYIDARRALLRHRRTWRETTAGFDAVITPTSPILPPEAERLASDGDYYKARNLLALRNTRAGNLMDCCGLSLPTGVPSTGLQMLAPAGSERLMLRLAAAAERALAA